MKLTSFESEIVDSLIWQVKGFQSGCVSERATKRVLRASLRRIKHRIVGASRKGITAQRQTRDHAVPVKVIISVLMEAREPDRTFVLSTLNNFYVSVLLCEEEHVIVLKSLGLESDMPPDWDGEDPFARYKAAGIEVLPLESNTFVEPTE
ncbi:MAG: hypothetical protein PVI37_11735 [Gammaproteobacteria bacterium]|jgi:hypothetical protein